LCDRGLYAAVVCDATLGQVFFLERATGGGKTSWVVKLTVGTGARGALVDGAAHVARFSNPHNDAVRRIDAAGVVPSA